MKIRLCFHPLQSTSSEHCKFAKSHHFVWSSVRNSTLNFAVFKVSKKPINASNPKKISFRFFFEPAKTSIEHVSPYILVTRVFAIPATFREFIFIVKLCLFTSILCARNLYSISYKQKKIPLVFRTYEHLKRCVKSIFVQRMT